MAAGKPVKDSQVEMVEIVLPQDTNPLGNVLGGHVMHLMDQAAAMAAIRHARRPVVTASVDKLDFRSPIKLGQFIILKASVNAAFHTSMEVGVRVESENPLSGERRHTSSAYFTFVALDEHGKPTTVPPLLAETEEQRRRMAEAEQRRQRRLREAKPAPGRKR
ncbi:MAG TPA: acyl-CoA thioesterase [Candidatus Thermoplasmatota archaeon]|jgi:acyl-CoA hydrolase|nr:acyl-CoA thioesterase [Candidatus Thermoplasmatota archaeon]